jgi:hypothetical protein
VNTIGRMCGTIDPGSCIRRVLGFGIKTGYDRSGTRAMFTVGMLAYIEESFTYFYFRYLQKYFILISRLCS